MIKYALRCEVDHQFDAWFDSSDGYDAQVRQGQVQCPLCGTTQVAKAIMAPSVHSSRAASDMMQTQKHVAEAMYRLRQHVESTHDYVGKAFASEARDIHDGLTPDRPIYGEATPQEIKALVDDGVPVAAISVFTPPNDDGAVKAVPPSLPQPLPSSRKLN